MMKRRELEMYSVKDVVEDLLSGVPVKRIARLRKASKNTVKRYRDNLHITLSEHPEFESSINTIRKILSNEGKKNAFRSILAGLIKSLILLNWTRYLRMAFFRQHDIFLNTNAL